MTFRYVWDGVVIEFLRQTALQGEPCYLQSQQWEIVKTYFGSSSSIVKHPSITCVVYSNTCCTRFITLFFFCNINLYKSTICICYIPSHMHTVLTCTVSWFLYDLLFDLCWWFWLIYSFSLLLFHHWKLVILTAPMLVNQARNAWRGKHYSDVSRVL